MSNLLIVESPAKCQKIRGFLGADWNVCATMGHLRALEESLETLGIGTTFQAKYHWLKEKDKAIQKLKSAAQEAEHIFLAADDDREGEMIAYSVCVLLRLSPDKTPRIVFHEITETAIRHALEHPRALDMNRVYAQETRAMLDMMIGFTMSPLLWKYVAPTLSAGRCQTPALRLVIERENNIESFVTSRSWIMNATWTDSSSLYLLHTTMMDELEDEESVQQVLEHANQTAYGKIAKKEIVRWSESAPDPLITSTLQQQASQLYHCSPKQTMCIAQRLYEAGHITYMRTDKAVMSEEAQTQAREWVKQNLGEEYIQEQRQERQEQSTSTKRMKVKRPQTKKKENQNQNAQEAHEAIRPTHMEVTSIPSGEWGPVERNIYQLISRRAIQSIMAATYGERCLITVEMDGLDDFPWRSEEKRTLFEGWKRMGRVAEIDDQEHEEKKEEDQKSEWSGSLWNEGDQVKWVRMTGEEKETKSQGRFTEASLVRELEKHGIGRPSTFASLLSVIQEKRYVEVQDFPTSVLSMKMYTLESETWPYICQQVSQKRGGEKRKLVPTALGRSVWEWLSQHFEDIFAYGFTGDMEQKLDEIAEGKKEEKELLREIWESYRERYETLKMVQLQQKQQLLQQQPSEDGPKRKIFKGGLKAIQTKKGPLLLREGETKDATEFFGWPKGVSWDKMTEQKALEYIESRKKEKEEEVHMEWLNQPVIKKTGPYGAYLQWDGISIPWIASESEQDTGERLEKKKMGGSFQTIKETARFMVRNGQYGPYITTKTKTKTKTKMVCVSIPKGLVVDGLTDKELEALYKAGMEKKKGTEKKEKNQSMNEKEEIFSEE